MPIEQPYYENNPDSSMVKVATTDTLHPLTFQNKGTKITWLHFGTILVLLIMDNQVIWK